MSPFKNPHIKIRPIIIIIIMMYLGAKIPEATIYSIMDLNMITFALVGKARINSLATRK